MAGKIDHAPWGGLTSFPPFRIRRPAVGLIPSATPLAFLFLLIMPSSIGDLGYISHGDALVKFMHPDINQSRVMALVSSVPVRYYEGLRTLRFYRYENARAGGMYWQGGTIHVYYCRETCSLDVLQHELAHHCQMMRGDRWRIAKRHKGQFLDCLDEIYEATRA